MRSGYYYMLSESNFELSDYFFIFFFAFGILFCTVGEQTPCKLSFVYTSQVNLTVRTEPKFGKYLMPFM